MEALHLEKHLVAKNNKDEFFGAITLPLFV